LRLVRLWSARGFEAFLREIRPVIEVDKLVQISVQMVQNGAK
jgi:hypothetical protein